MPVTCTHSSPYAPWQIPVHQGFFAILCTEEGKECASRVSLFHMIIGLGLDVVQLGVTFSTGALTNPGL
jgi:hypothetical protein